MFNCTALLGQLYVLLQYSSFSKAANKLFPMQILILRLFYTSAGDWFATMDTLAVSSAEESGTTSVNDVETSVPGISVVQVAIPNQAVQVLVVWCRAYYAVAVANQDFRFIFASYFEINFGTNLLHQERRKSKNNLVETVSSTKLFRQKDCNAKYLWRMLYLYGQLLKEFWCRTGSKKLVLVFSRMEKCFVYE